MAEQVLISCDVEKGTSKYLLMFTNTRVAMIHVAGGAWRVLSAGLVRDRYEASKIGKIKQQDVDQLLGSSEKSFFIPYDQVARIFVDKGSMLSSGSVTISTIGGQTTKYKGKVKNKLAEMERLLRPYLREKLQIKT